MRKKPREKPRKSRWKKSRLEDLICRATLDAYDDEEEQLGFFTAIEEHVRFPFKATVLGVEVAVRGIEVNDADEIVAVCFRDRQRQAVPLLDLPLSKPPPKGAEWIEAYRLWVTE